MSIESLKYDSSIVRSTSGNSSNSTTDAAIYSNFEVNVSKEDFKFNAAHFVAFPGFRERLHGHNYRVGVRLLGRTHIGADGYVVDFGCIKDVCKNVCKRLNEHFLCPIYSDVLTITHSDNQVHILCKDDGSKFSFPDLDCAMLPIVHATTEELCIYLWAEMLKGLHASYLLQRNIHTMEITVAEAPGQEAVFRMAIPAPTATDDDKNNAATTTTSDFILDVREFIVKGKIVPMPCTSDTLQACCKDCGKSRLEFSQQLEALAKAINQGNVPSNVTVNDLKSLIHHQV